MTPVNQYLFYGLIALILAGVGYGAYTQFAPQAQNGEPQNGEEQQNQDTMDIKIALLDTTGDGQGPPRGCDRLAMVTRTVPKSDAVLTAALQALFAEPEGTQPSQTYNFLARTKETLKFDHATVENGIANIYLTGQLSGLAGVCDDPRAEIQITDTAMQFPTVEKVQIYLNGTAVKLTPVGQGS